MRIRIERLGVDAPPEPLTVDRLVDGLDRAVGWLVEDSNRWADWIDFYRDRPNEFVTGMPGWTADGAQAALGRLLHFCYWQVQPDEALVIRVTPPRLLLLELRTRQLLDELGRLPLPALVAELRTSGARGRRLGRHRRLASRPGHPNWLDTGGHTAGLMPQRWVEADDIAYADHDPRSLRRSGPGSSVKVCSALLPSTTPRSSCGAARSESTGASRCE